MDEEILDDAIERTAAGRRPVGRPQEWTAQERAKLREMYAGGSRLKVIAKAMGRTVRALDNKLVRLGLRPRISRTYQEIIWTPEQIDELRELCADARLSAADIAARVGKTRNAVIGKISRLGIVRTKKPPAKPKNRPAARIMEATVAIHQASQTTRREDHQASQTPSQRLTVSTAGAQRLTVSTPGASRLIAEDRMIMDEAERFLPPPPKTGHLQGNKTFFELGPRDCRFPLGGPMEPAVLFCGAVTVAVLAPYCREHSRLCGGKYTKAAA